MHSVDFFELFRCVNAAHVIFVRQLVGRLIGHGEAHKCVMIQPAPFGPLALGLAVFSPVLRDSTPHTPFVGPSVSPLARPSHFTFIVFLFAVFGLLAHAQTIK